MFSKVREQFGEVVSALAVLLELERAADNRVRKRETSLEFAGEVGDAVERFPVKLVEQGFVFKGIDLAHSSLHEQEDAMLGPPRNVRGLAGKGIGQISVGASLLGCQAGQCQRTQAVPRSCKKIAARGERQGGGWGRVHV